MFYFSFNVSFVIILAFLSKGISFVVEELVKLWSVDLVRPPTQGERLVVVDYKFRL